MSALPDLTKTATPIADAAAALIGTSGAWIVTLGALLSMAGTNSGTVLEGSRMLYALSLDKPGLAPIRYVHPRFRTPIVAIGIHVIVATALALGGSFAQLALLSAVARLTTYLFTCAALPRLRGSWRLRDLPLPILGTAISLWIVVTLDRGRLMAGSIALLVGAVVWLFS